MGNQQGTKLCISEKENNWLMINNEIKNLDCDLTRGTRSNIWYMGNDDFQIQRKYCPKCGEPVPYDGEILRVHCKCEQPTIDLRKLIIEPKQYIPLILEVIKNNDLVNIIYEYVDTSIEWNEINQKTQIWKGIHSTINYADVNDVDIYPRKLIWSAGDIMIENKFCKICGDPDIDDEKKTVRCRCNKKYYCDYCGVFGPTSRKDNIVKCKCNRVILCKYCGKSVKCGIKERLLHHKCKLLSKIKK